MTKASIVSVLGRDKGYTAKYNPFAAGGPKGTSIFLLTLSEKKIVDRQRNKIQIIDPPSPKNKILDP